MKTKFLFIALFFLAFGTTDAFSQYYGNGGYGGVDRSIGASARQNKPSKKNAEKKDYADVYTEYLTKEIKLDGLQQAAVRSIVNDHKDSLEEIAKSNLPSIEKRDKMQFIYDQINAKIIKLLSKEQNDNFLKLKEEAEKKAMTY